MLALAHLLALAFGFAVYATLVEQPRDIGAVLRAAGYGYVIGIAATGFAIAAIVPHPVDAFRLVAIPLAACTVALVFWGRVRQARRASVIAGDLAAGATQAGARWTPWLVAALLAWLALRGLSLAYEAGSRPAFPWDAWSTWLVKAKTWFLADAWLPFAGVEGWPASQGSRFIAAHHYPDGMAYVQLWFAAAVGAWDESSIFSFWPACWLAGMAILAGQLRAMQVPWWLCIVATYAWASLPLVQTHVALPGYVDLPMTVMFGAVALAIARAQRDAGLRQGALGLLLALCLPLLKHEGALWLLVFALAAALVVLASLRRARIAVALGALLGLAWMTVGVHLWLPGLGWVEAQGGTLHVPALPLSIALEWRPVHREVIG